MQPKHHHPASKLTPAVPEADNTFAGHGQDPGLSAKEDMEHTAGQPDKWPQRPDVPVQPSGSNSQVPVPLD